MHSSAVIYEWTPDLAVGNEAIDAEHRTLFDLAERLHQAMLRGSGKVVLDQCLTDLINYSYEHFRHEEQLMERTLYPERETHKAQHDALRHNVSKLQERFRDGEETLTIELMQFITEWVTRHTSLADRRIAAFFAQRET